MRKPHQYWWQDMIWALKHAHGYNIAFLLHFRYADPLGFFGRGHGGWCWPWQWRGLYWDKLDHKPL